MIAKYYRINMSFVDAFKLPYGFLHYLYYKAVQETKLAPGKKAAEEVEDNLRGDS